MWSQRLVRRGLFLGGLLVTWAAVSRWGPWPEHLFPGPVAVTESLFAMAKDGRLFHAIGTSLSRLLRGYVLSVALGLPLGVALARLHLVRLLLRPLVVGLQALPSICWLPLALLWFGLTDTAILFVVVMGSVLAIAIATEDAVLGVDPILLRAAATFGIKGARHAVGVLLPAAMPGVVTALKLGWSFAWRALLAGELLFVSGGLGQLLQTGRELMDIPQVCAVMVAIIVIGVLIDRALFRSVEFRVRRRWGVPEAA